MKLILTQSQMQKIMGDQWSKRRTQLAYKTFFEEEGTPLKSISWKRRILKVVTTNYYGHGVPYESVNRLSHFVYELELENPDDDIVLQLKFGFKDS